MARRNSGLAVASKIQRAPTIEVSEPAESGGRSASSRAGKAMVAGWFDKAAVKQLRLIAVNRETTMQQQIGRALNLLFREEGLPALAQIEREDAA
jgi:antitoxin-like ribbon-helix-helix protein